MGVDSGQKEGDTKKKLKEKVEDLDAIRADVASFAASLGLGGAGSGGNGGGFDDTDFRQPNRPINPSSEKATKKAVRQQPADKHLTERAKKSETTPRVVKQEKERTKQPLEDAAAPPEGSKVDSIQKRTSPVQSTVRWFEHDAAQLATGPGVALEQAQSLRAEGERLLTERAADWEKQTSRRKQGSVDMDWLRTVRQSGTTSDKLAALTVIVQEEAMANLRSLDVLLGMVESKGGKRQAAQVMDALKELFLLSLLPDRKLRPFEQQPLGTLNSSTQRATQLLYWYFEDVLKQRYDRFLTAIEAGSRDNLTFFKEKSLKTAHDLIVTKPEQERRLLALLVNKLGDPERKVASKSVFLLSSLLTRHPNMKPIVVREMDAFTFRPRVGLRAQYYAIIFLNQIILSHKGDGPAVAKALIHLYFTLFKTLMTSSEVEEPSDKPAKKLQSAKKQKGRKGKHTKRHHHPRKKQPATSGTTAGINEGVDARLLSALLTGINRAFPFVSADDAGPLVAEHAPVLFQMAHGANINGAIQALVLLHQLITSHQAISDRFYRALYTVLISSTMPRSSKAALFLSLLFKAMRADINSSRVAAFAKRLLQVAMHQSAAFACGALMLISEVLKAHPVAWNAIMQPEDHEDDVERFQDADDGLTNASSKDATSEGDNKRAVAVRIDLDEGSSKENDAEENGSAVTRAHVRSRAWPAQGGYDMKKREPEFSHAENACWWELSCLASHVHPSVAAMSRTLLAGANVVYAGNPLRDLSLAPFLDKFIDKKPKALRMKEKMAHRGASLMQPTAPVNQPTQVTSEEFVHLPEHEVDPADVFFHRFYSAKAQKRIAAAASDEEVKDAKMKGDADEFSDDSDAEVDAFLDSQERKRGSGMAQTQPSEGDYSYDQLADALEYSDVESGDSEGEVLPDEEDVAGDEGDDSDDAGMVMLDTADVAFSSDEDEVVEVGDAVDKELHEDALDAEELEEQSETKKRKKGGKKGKKAADDVDKLTGGKVRPSPFAAAEAYEHMLESDGLQAGDAKQHASLHKRPRKKHKQ
eukprot:jgi/Chlat1/4965/Chrsp32S04947